MQNFQLRRVRKREHVVFNLLTFFYFRRADNVRFLIESGPFAAFFIIPYVVFSEVYFLRQWRFFVLLGNQIMGVVALKDEVETLHVSSMAVSPHYRRIGVATYALNQAAAIASKLGKEALELTVVKWNTPAIRLYIKNGYRLQAENRRSLILRKLISKLS